VYKNIAYCKLIFSGDTFIVVYVSVIELRKLSFCVTFISFKFIIWNRCIIWNRFLPSAAVPCKYCKSTTKIFFLNDLVLVQQFFHECENCSAWNRGSIDRDHLIMIITWLWLWSLAYSFRSALHKYVKTTSPMFQISVWDKNNVTVWHWHRYGMFQVIFKQKTSSSLKTFLPSHRIGDGQIFLIFSVTELKGKSMDWYHFHHC
jgi:hypothetical protein